MNKLFREVYVKVKTQTTAINGFKKCGIISLNLNVLEDSDFIAAETTEIALIDLPIAENLRSEPTKTLLIAENSRSKTNCNIPIEEETQPSTSFIVSPSNDIYISKTNIKSRVCNRKNGIAAVFPSSLYKAKLEALKIVTTKKRLFTKKKSKK